MEIHTEYTAFNIKELSLRLKFLFNPNFLFQQILDLVNFITLQSLNVKYFD